MRKSKYQQLNDEGWLRQKYLDEQLSMPQIGEIVGAPNPTVLRALRRWGIPTRNISDAMMIGGENDHFKFDQSVINGCLLGDGCLQSYSRSQQSLPRFECRHKDPAHVMYVAEILFEEEPEKRVFEEKVFSKVTQREQTCYTLRSLAHSCLKPVMEEWYPETSGYRKIVPPSLVLDTTSILHWFMDDGTAHQSKPGRVDSVRFCSESFTRSDQEKLVEQMNSVLGIDAALRPYRAGTGWRIAVYSADLNRFYSQIGPPPIPSLAYKWGDNYGKQKT